MNKRLVAALIVLAFGAGLGVGYLIWRGKGGGGETDEQLASDSIPDFPTPSEGERERVRERTKVFIEMLASKNPAPAKPIANDPIVLPMGYDTKLQIPVWTAVDLLIAENEACIDVLLEHQDDKRYSFSTTSQVGLDSNWTVSEVCGCITMAKLLCYDNDMILETDKFFRMPDEVKLEWKENKHKGLAHVQVLAIDKALTFMREADWKSARPWHPEAKTPTREEFEKEREAKIAALRVKRRTIIETRKPLPVTRLLSSHETALELPGSVGSFNR